MGNRKIRKIKTSRDPKTNNIDYLGSENEFHRYLEESDTVDSLYNKEEVANHCGCYGPVGGKCGCGNFSCRLCHTHCGGTDNPSPLGCGVPLCRECSHFTDLPNGKTIPLCSSCAGKYSRKKIKGKITRFFLESGIEFEDTND